MSARNPELETVENARPAPRPCIWAVGGGKGGVGKSVVSSSLGIALAQRGERCVLIDADLGGANLHTLLGMRSPKRTLSAFIRGDVKRLPELLTDAPVPGLQLVSGARALLGMANPTHSQKSRLLRHIRALDVDHVILDLAAGSAFNVLDFFLEADRGLLVVTPEATSIENAYHFLKAAFMRSLRQTAKRESIRSPVQRVLDHFARRRALSPRELLRAVRAADPDAGRALLAQARCFRPELVVNQIRDTEDRKLGDRIAAACRDHLGARVRVLGSIDADEAVRVSLRRRRPALLEYPDRGFALDVETIVNRMLGLEPYPAQPRGLAARELSRRNGAPEATLATCGLLGEERPRRERARPNVELPALNGAEPGAYLKHCRELLQLDLSDVYRTTKIPSLERLERQQFDELPPATYVKGYVVQYAEALGLADAAEDIATRYLERYRAAASG